ncbi:MAG: carboxypeptidase-like regulatory domain-containing protein [Gemmatimonadota bacterium]
MRDLLLSEFRGSGPGKSLVVLATALLVAACGADPRVQSRDPAVPASGAGDAMPLDSLRFGLVGHPGAFAEESRAIPGFAGTYFEAPCTRVVLVTDSTRAAAAAARSFHAANPAGCEDGEVVVRKARYPWDQLERWYFDDLERLGAAGLTVRGISPVRNRLVVGVADEAAWRRIEEKLRRLPVPRDAVLVAITRAPPAPAGFVLEVAVLDLARQPVPGVRVEAFRAGECVQVENTGASGIAVMDSLPMGVYSVRVVGPPGRVPAFVPLYRQAHQPSVQLREESVDDNRLRFVLLPFEDWPPVEPSPSCDRGVRPGG